MPLPKLNLSPETKAKLQKIGKGALIAIGGAAVQYGGALLATGAIAGFGPFGPLVAVVASVGINAAAKYLEKTKAEHEAPVATRIGIFEPARPEDEHLPQHPTY